MAGVAGFDISVFPGAAEMAWLKANTNLDWCGYYLAPAPSHATMGWTGQRAALQTIGWGIAPIYVGQQLRGPGSHVVTAAQGTIDGGDAVRLLNTDGFQHGTSVYLDLEDGPPFNAPRTAYVAAWAAAVAASAFRPAVYCSHGFATDLRRALPSVRIWAFRVPTTDQQPFPGIDFPDPDPSGSGLADAFIWQHRQNCRLTLPGAPTGSLVVDLDSALTADPGAP